MVKFRMSKPYQVIAEWRMSNQSSKECWETFTGSNARKEAVKRLREVAKDLNNFGLRLVEHWTNGAAVEAK